MFSYISIQIFLFKALDRCKNWTKTTNQVLVSSKILTFLHYGLKDLVRYYFYWNFEICLFHLFSSWLHFPCWSLSYLVQCDFRHLSLPKSSQNQSLHHMQLSFYLTCVAIVFFHRVLFYVSFIFRKSRESLNFVLEKKIYSMWFFFDYCSQKKNWESKNCLKRLRYSYD